MDINIKKSMENCILATIMKPDLVMDKDLDKMLEIELDEDLFTGYNKSIVRAINIVSKKELVASDLQVEDFLKTKNHFNSEFYETLASSIIPYFLLVQYLDSLQEDYYEGLI